MVWIQWRGEGEKDCLSGWMAGRWSCCAVVFENGGVEDRFSGDVGCGFGVMRRVLWFLIGVFDLNGWMVRSGWLYD
jgi:hypothetical protein